MSFPGTVNIGKATGLGDGEFFLGGVGFEVLMGPSVMLFRKYLDRRVWTPEDFLLPKGPRGPHSLGHDVFFCIFQRTTLRAGFRESCQSLKETAEQRTTISKKLL